ncbi:MULTISPECIES: hypothetical protein [unclassified Arthrobacter]|uniref:hypothetical protein n=2 Tax=Arthrobacter TaxID=1663 RepID=UPI000CE37504|nr:MULTISPECIES: hypothetical protein [unclassified Arthrobacter]
MGHHRNAENMPQDEHLRDDINLPVTDTADNGNEHLAEDINLPRESGVGPEFDDRHYTAGQLNAGQQVAGLSPSGEYAKMREEELEN